MHDAQLHLGPGKRRLDGLGETCEPIQSKATP